jgi:hypothetical protein
VAEAYCWGVEWPLSRLLALFDSYRLGREVTYVAQREDTVGFWPLG